MPQGTRKTLAYMQSRINHLVGPTHFTTVGSHWEARRRRCRDRDAFGIEGEGNEEGVSRLGGLGERRSTDFVEI